MQRVKEKLQLQITSFHAWSDALLFTNSVIFPVFSPKNENVLFIRLDSMAFSIEKGEEASEMNNNKR